MRLTADVYVGVSNELKPQFSLSHPIMTRPKLYLTLGSILLLVIGTACNTRSANQEAATAAKVLPIDLNSEGESSNSDQLVVSLTSEDKTLDLDEIEVFLEFVKKDKNGLPELIEVSYRNKSSQRGCLALPRPVVEDTSYDLSHPCICVVVDALFLFTVPKGSQHQPLTGIYLEPGGTIRRQYKLSSFCVIGHGIGPKAPANFSSCYSAGEIEKSMQVWIVKNWIDLDHIASKDVSFRASEVDLSVRYNIEE